MAGETSIQRLGNATPAESLSKWAKLKSKLSKDKGAAPADAKSSGNSYIDVGSVVVIDSSKNQAEREKRGTHDKESGGIVITKERKMQYQRQLTQYAHGLARVWEQNKAILDSPNHKFEQDHLKLFTKDGDMKTIDPELIMKFIESNNGQGIALSTMILEQQAVIALFGLGLDQAARVPHASPLPDRLVAGPLKRRLDAGSRTAAGRVGSEAAAAVVGGATGLGTFELASYLADHGIDISLLTDMSGEGALRTAAVGVGVVGSVFLRRMISPEGAIDMRSCVDGLNALKTSSTEVAYLQIMTGIDANDFQVDLANNRVIRTPGRIPTTVGLRTQEERIRDILKTRDEFYKDLGSTTTRRGRTIDQLITSFHAGSEDKAVTTWEQKIISELKPDEPPYSTASADARMILMAEARRKVMVDYTEKQLSALGKGQRERKSSTLDQRKKDLGESAKKKFDEEQGKKITLRTDDQTILNDAVDSLSQKPEGAAEVTYDALERAIKDHFTKDPAKIEAAIKIYSDFLNGDETVGGSYLNQKKTLVKAYDRKTSKFGEKERLAYTARTDRPKISVETGSGKGRTTIERDMTWEEYRNAEIKKLKEELVDNLRILDEKKADYKERIPLFDRVRDKLEVEKGSTPNKTQIQQEAKNAKDELDTLIGWPITYLGSVDNIDIVLHRINTLHAAGVGVGWPAEQNDFPGNRRKVLLAMMHARAVAGKDVESDDIKPLVKANQAQLDRLNYDKEKYKVSKTGEETIDLSKTLVDDHDKIMSRTGSVDMTSILDGNLIPAGDTRYTAEEQTLSASTNAPRGYFEMLDLIAQYKTPPEGMTRDEYRAKLSTALTPDKLRDVIVDSGVSPVLLPHGADLSTILNMLRPYYTTHAMGEIQLRNIIRTMTDVIYQEALTV